MKKNHKVKSDFKTRYYQYRGMPSVLVWLILLFLPLNPAFLPSPETEYFSTLAPELVDLFLTMSWYEGVKEALPIPIFFLFVGVVLRIWSRRLIGMHSRGHKLAAPILLQTGPYSISRNPLYISNLSIAFGIIFLRGESFLAVGFCVVLVLHYWWVAKIEEEYLQKEFGEEYNEWKKKTPFFLGPFRYVSSLQTISEVQKSEFNNENTVSTHNFKDKSLRLASPHLLKKQKRKLPSKNSSNQKMLKKNTKNVRGTIIKTILEDIWSWIWLVGAIVSVVWISLPALLGIV